MKKRLLAIAAGTLLAAGLHAQSSTRMIADVPFGFAVGNSNFPAGQYTVSWGKTPGIVMVQAADMSSSAMVCTNAAYSGKRTETSHLVFRRYGDYYFLAQAWTPGGEVGRQIPPNPREREMARNYTTSTQEIVLARAS